ncbi:MAG: hypothetical protein M1830_003064 [Pleopsidium flavum]|nr:MAG: hypothetical protein M1830_003064 [Pleopsidium flavum]
MLFSKILGNSLSVFFLASGAWSAPPRPTEALKPRTISIGPTSPYKPWPNKQLRYRFIDNTSRDKLSGIFADAWKMWTDAGVTNVRIVRDDTSADALQIKYVTDGKVSTTIAWTSGGAYMNFDDSGAVGIGNPIINMAHEIGHALGLLHEHQREDSIDYIKFNCENLEDYTEAKADLCTKQLQAKLARFSAFDYIPYNDETNFGWQVSVEYDKKSLMHYGGGYGGKRGKKGIRAVVLENRDGSPVGNPDRPSEADVRRVQALYA